MSPYARVASSLGLAAVVLLGAGAAEAALTRESCLAKKRLAHGKLQACRATEEAKALQGKPADAAKCDAKFQETIAKLSQKASAAGLDCRFVDGGNSITDFDTGLQWVETENLDGVQDFGNPRDADNTYYWCAFLGGSAADGTVFTDYLSRLNACNSEDGITNVFAGYAARCDWRMPTPAELQTILLAPSPCGTSPCIDPVFGATAPDFYWSSTNDFTLAISSWAVSFSDGSLDAVNKVESLYVRAVRRGF